MSVHVLLNLLNESGENRCFNCHFYPIIEFSSLFVLSYDTAMSALFDLIV